MEYWEVNQIRIPTFNCLHQCSLFLSHACQKWDLQFIGQPQITPIIIKFQKTSQKKKTSWPYSESTEQLHSLNHLLRSTWFIVKKKGSKLLSTILVCICSHCCIWDSWAQFQLHITGFSTESCLMDEKDTTLVCLVNEAHIGQPKLVLTILKTVQKHVVSRNLDKQRFLPMWDAMELLYLFH